MGAYYDEVEIEDMTFDPVKKVFHYPCPCGDRFEITKAQLRDCEDIAICPSCSLVIRVIFDPLDYEDYEDSDEEDAEEGSEEEDSEDESDDDATFEDALENLSIADHASTLPAVVSVSA
jgi:diphthamide biosynthesis protein 3